jgi:hypothetical protein
MTQLPSPNKENIATHKTDNGLINTKQMSLFISDMVALHQK